MVPVGNFTGWMMSRTGQKWICRQDDEGKFSLIPVEEACKPAGKVHVIQDSMDPTWHPCTGETMDSRSQFKRVTKAHGCIEVGNDPSVMNPKPREYQPITPVRQTLIQAYKGELPRDR